MTAPNSNPLFATLAELLKADARLVSSDGQLLRNTAIEFAQQGDPVLIRALRADAHLRATFFVEVDDILVFDSQRFGWVIRNREFLPDSYTRFRNLIGLADAQGRIIAATRDVELVWPYKDCFLEAGQEREQEKRREIFYNQTLAPDDIDSLLAPKVLTEATRYTAEGTTPAESFEDDDNLILRGNNLVALASIAERYAGQVKLIYIDPPFGTGSDGFEYNDRFALSSWLTFMKNRLEFAQRLLSDDGALFLHISDLRVHHVRLLLDEIFGPQNMINLITVKTRSPSGFKTVNPGVFESAEYIFAYAKNKRHWNYNTQHVGASYDANFKFEVIDNTGSESNWEIRDVKAAVAQELGFTSTRQAKQELGTAYEAAIAEYALTNRERVFRYTEINFDAGRDTLALKERSLEEPNRVFRLERDGLNDRLIHQGKEIYFYAKKVREIDGVLVPTTLLTNIWTDIPYEGIANEGTVQLKRGKKPERLLRRILNMASKESDLVLDFFLGSGTTAAVAHKMRRRYIGIEQLDYVETKAVRRLSRVVAGAQDGISKLEGWEGGGSFVFVKLLALNERFVEEIGAATTAEGLAALIPTLESSASLDFRVDLARLRGEGFGDLDLEDQKRVLMAALDKNRLYVNYDEMADEEFAVQETDRKFTNSFYGVGS